MPRFHLYHAPHSPLEWLLRLGVCGTFLGHGLVCFGYPPAWVPFLTFWGIDPGTAHRLFPLIGSVDVLIACVALVRPIGPLLLYAALWAFLAALMRPLTGLGWLPFVERAANWLMPLALWAYRFGAPPDTFTKRTPS